ncbi:Uma2 family endonuclease [Thiorhodococcus mannitoliphagus]|uniref:Uma2 family endonuclease n=1 Tax=Thiorhodococcus mannitoliphagus TaxID=329406 RepID=A0A6P1DY73_9GAMM|nr:Uma2 family endonuclease [Thiorhodococcus mannitoliphagus]NEX22430.1 Uma2 family endonuclease [Thiorhodococcus mannitoliphagus]
MGAQAQSGSTPRDYLAWERRQETRHEYIRGEIFEMTGASREHNLICGNLFAMFHGQLRGRPCEVYVNDMRVKVTETGIYVYPDIVALCEPPRFEDNKVDTLLNPGLIVEVLSQSTESDDRGAKFAHYRNLPSLAHYLLVSQTECRVEHFTRQSGNRWLLTEYQAPDDSIPLTDMDCSLRLADIYERLSLSAQPTPGEVAEGTTDQPR